MVNQTNIGTVSKAALGKHLKDGVGPVTWAFPSPGYHPNLKSTEQDDYDFVIVFFNRFL